MQASAKDIPLRQRLSVAVAKQKTVFPVSNERLEHLCKFAAQMHLANSTAGFGRLDGSSPNGLLHIERPGIRGNVLADFESEGFADAESRSCEQRVEHTSAFVGAGNDGTHHFCREVRPALVLDFRNIHLFIAPLPWK